jgi:hypothetical protein
MPLTKIQSLGITDGTIVNADINASAAIAGTKLTGVGKVLQVVQGSLTSAFSTTSTSFVTSGLTASITPSSASNKVLILVTCCNCYTQVGNLSGHTTIYLDNTTNLAPQGSANYRSFGTSYSAAGTTTLTHGYSFLHSPSTTSSTTYTVYAVAESGTTFHIHVNGGSSYINLLEIAG